MSPQPILVIDEHAIDNDVVMYVKSCFRLKNGNLYDLNSNVWRCMPNPDARKQPFQKVIAGVSVLPSIDWSALSEEDCMKIAWFDANAYCDKVLKNGLFIDNIKQNYSLAQLSQIYSLIYFAFETGKTLNEKKFSLEDMKTAITAAWMFGQRQENNLSDSIDLIIQSFSQTQPKVFDVEIEMEKVYLINDKWVNYFESSFFPHLVEQEKLQPKITNNSIKILKLSVLQ